MYVFLLFLSLKLNAECSTSTVLKSAVIKEKVHHVLSSKDEVVGKLIIGAQTEEKVIALTFDDGPNSYTTRLIKVLKEESCPAAFFLIGSSLKDRQRVLFLYKDPLFEIGMHGFYHNNYSKYECKKLEDEVKKMIKEFSNYGIESKYFRPPYGAFNYQLLETLKKNSLIGIMWNIDSEDWKHNKSSSKDNFIANIIEALEPGSIILLHEKIELLFVKSLIREIRNLDYKIIPLSELLNKDKIFCKEVIKEINFSYKNRN